MGYFTYLLCYGLVYLLTVLWVSVLALSATLLGVSSSLPVFEGCVCWCGGVLHAGCIGGE